MEPIVSSLLLVLVSIVVLIGAGLWIFAAILVVALSALVMLGDYSILRAGLLMQSSLWNSSTGWELLSIPLFIWMGELLLRTDLTGQLFKGLIPWVNRLPGGLLHTNTLGCSLFAAVSGSSTATTAAIGKITASELSRRGYSKSLSLGSLAGAGTLGIMIPPSIPLIVYGVLAEVSILRLFTAGILPGLLLACMFSIYIAMICAMKPELAPRDKTSYRWSDRIRALADILPFASLLAVVMGMIYSGIATPSESAAVGLLWSLILVVSQRKLNKKLFLESLLSATLTSSMLCVIIVAASFLAAVFGLLHLPQGVSAMIAELKLSSLGLLAVLTLIYIILGCFLDGVSMIVLTLPLVLPMVTNAGFDPLWFGIYLVLVIEMAMITPPVGFNLFVIRGITGESIASIARYAFPFFLLLVALVLIIYMRPDLVTILPDLMTPEGGRG